jgi:hypothetical protein
VRAREDFVGFHLMGLTEAIAPAAPPDVEIKPRSVSPRATAKEPLAWPPAAFEAKRQEPLEAPAPLSSGSAVRSRVDVPATAPPSSVPGAVAPRGEEAVESKAHPQAIAEAAPANVRAEPPGWQVLAEPEPVAVSPLESAAVQELRPASRAARESTARATDAPSPAAVGVPAALAPPIELGSPVSPPSPQSAAPAARAASPPPSAAPAKPALSPPPAPSTPEPPRVLIDRIEVITPPAGTPAPDPFASLATRRSGASRHGRRA